MESDSIIQILANVGGRLYVYCTEFTINLANLTGTSYYEINFFFFCILTPLLIITLPLIAVFLKFRLYYVKRKYGKINS